MVTQPASPPHFLFPPLPVEGVDGKRGTLMASKQTDGLPQICYVKLSLQLAPVLIEGYFLQLSFKLVLWKQDTGHTGPLMTQQSSF